MNNFMLYDEWYFLEHVECKNHCAGSLLNHNEKNGGSLQVSDVETNSWPIRSRSFMVIKSITIEFVNVQLVGPVSREINTIPAEKK